MKIKELLTPPDFEIRAKEFVDEINLQINDKYSFDISAMNSTMSAIERANGMSSNPYASEDTIYRGGFADIDSAIMSVVAVWVLGPNSMPESDYEKAFKEIHEVATIKYGGVKSDGSEQQQVYREESIAHSEKDGLKGEHFFYIFQ